MLKATALALALALLAAPAALCQPVAVDGDTLKADGVTWRLWGIDAPEIKQWCSGQLVGEMAAGTLEMLMKGKAVTCETGAGTDTASPPSWLPVDRGLADAHRTA
jgi:hypothetical protein